MSQGNWRSFRKKNLFDVVFASSLSSQHRHVKIYFVLDVYASQSRSYNIVFFVFGTAKKWLPQRLISRERQNALMWHLVSPWIFSFLRFAFFVR